MPDPHTPSCAKRIRERAAADDWPLARTAAAITGCCAVTRLRAHRLARGWSLRETVDAYRLMTRDLPRAARVDQDQLRIWETCPDRRPRAATIDLLCRLYRTNATELGLTGDYADTTTTGTGGESVRVPGGGPEPALPPPGPAAAPPAGDPLDALLDRARRGVDRTLAQGTVSQTQLDLLDERLLDLRHTYLVTPPVAMLGQLLPELDEVRTLAAERQPATVQMRLSEMTALLATLTADALMRLGRLRQARAWFATARAAADDSTHTELRARVRAQAAMLPYYYGPLASAAALAREARVLSRHRPTATGAFAAAAEARALARQGDADGTQHAIRTAQDAFDRCHHGDENDAFAFPRRRLLLYLSGALTYLGHTRRAREIQQEALTLYTDHRGIDPALLHLEQAICLARDHHLDEACRLAAATYLQQPTEQRTPLLGARAHDVLDAIPAAMRTARPARELGEVLALPAGAR
ncbi:hypothetical protein ACFWPV_12295 [Streptomyces uncialis]|uniref:hypothetical protein n=1 Tax=Streptomyces uncialis TaxID=1048205 RepID=UPI003669EE52